MRSTIIIIRVLPIEHDIVYWVVLSTNISTLLLYSWRIKGLLAVGVDHGPTLCAPLATVGPRVATAPSVVTMCTAKPTKHPVTALVWGCLWKECMHKMECPPTSISYKTTPTDHSHTDHSHTRIHGNCCHPVTWVPQKRCSLESSQLCLTAHSHAGKGGEGGGGGKEIGSVLSHTERMCYCDDQAQ